MRILDLFRRKKQPASDPVLAALTKGRCPDCNGDMFYAGPQGGLAQNIQCANKSCGSKFNVAPFDNGFCGPLFLAQRIG